MNLIAKRKIWYAISLVLIIPGLVALFTRGLRLGIDFTGGSLMEVQGRVTEAQVGPLAAKQGLKNLTITPSGEDRTLLRFRDETADPAEREQHHQDFKAALAARGATEVRFDNVGPSVSKDIARNAIVAVLLAALAIMFYVAIAFRNAPPPVSPTSFGLATIVALVHDALFLIGLFALLGIFFKIEIDSLFVTAVLTVIGFSVHDTIVVFDRIRENLRRERKPFEEVVNDSILETMARSINTSLTVLLTLLALLLFGGQSIKIFVLALLAGIASGTYSSVFNASPLLVTWHNRKLKKRSP
jgi:preprotein translocase subunit SecF